MAQTRRRVDVAKHRHWQITIGEAARSGLSIREFCRQRKLTVSHFYWWQRRLGMSARKGLSRKLVGCQNPASFALVTNDPAATDAGIELVIPGNTQVFDEEVGNVFSDQALGEIETVKDSLSWLLEKMPKWAQRIVEALLEALKLTRGG